MDNPFAISVQYSSWMEWAKTTAFSQKSIIKFEGQSMWRRKQWHLVFIECMKNHSGIYWTIKYKHKVIRDISQIIIYLTNIECEIYEKERKKGGKKIFYHVQFQIKMSKDMWRYLKELMKAEPLLRNGMLRYINFIIHISQIIDEITVIFIILNRSSFLRLKIFPFSSRNNRAIKCYKFCNQISWGHLVIYYGTHPSHNLC